MTINAMLAAIVPIGYPVGDDIDTKALQRVVTTVMPESLGERFAPNQRVPTARQIRN